MQLTKRLYEIASLVPKGSTMVDVGTDHGYIPIYLTHHAICNKCIASDVNKGPLESAKRHMDQNGFQNIDLRLGSGLSTVDPEEGVEVAVIAGMGGLLIIDILKKDLKVVKGLKKLILQPQSNLPEVRKFVHQIGFKIEEEHFLLDEGKYYTIMSLVPGEESYVHSYEYEYGRYLIKHPNAAYLQWLAHKKQVFDKIKISIQVADEATRMTREEALKEEINIYEEALACIVSKKL